MEFSAVQMALRLVGAGSWGAEPSAPNDLTDAQVHLGLRGLWLLNCQHTHYNHIFICSWGVHLWLVSWKSDCSGESPSVKE